MDYYNDLFEKFTDQHTSIKKNSSPIGIKFRLLGFLISNRLYFNKFRKLFYGSHEKTGQTLYDNPPSKN